MKEESKGLDFRKIAEFKYVFGDQNDPESMYLLKMMIEEILNIKIESIISVDRDAISNHYDKNVMLLDIVAKTVEGEYISVQMKTPK